MHPLVKRYLELLELSAQVPTYNFLCVLQKKHIETVPHENIDGIFNIPTEFSISRLLYKYCVEKRGGMCFELNYSYGWLLKELGYNVELMLANVKAYDLHEEKNEYPTHPVIIVHLDKQLFLTDVGWSDSYRNPLNLSGTEYKDATGNYRITTVDGNVVMQKKLKKAADAMEETWIDQFIFQQPKGPQNHFLLPQGFFASNAYTRVSPGYLFTNLLKFTQVSEHGHQTIWGNQLRSRQHDQRKCIELKEKIPQVLQGRFDLPQEVAVKCTKLKRTQSFPNFYKLGCLKEKTKNAANEHLVMQTY